MIELTKSQRKMLEYIRKHVDHPMKSPFNLSSLPLKMVGNDDFIFDLNKLVNLKLLFYASIKDDIGSYTYDKNVVYLTHEGSTWHYWYEQKLNDTIYTPAKIGFAVSVASNLIILAVTLLVRLFLK